MSDVKKDPLSELTREDLIALVYAGGYGFMRTSREDVPWEIVPGQAKSEAQQDFDLRQCHRLMDAEREIRRLQTELAATQAMIPVPSEVVAASRRSAFQRACHWWEEELDRRILAEAGIALKLRCGLCFVPTELQDQVNLRRRPLIEGMKLIAKEDRIEFSLRDRPTASEERYHRHDAMCYDALETAYRARLQSYLEEKIPTKTLDDPR